MSDKNYIGEIDGFKYKTRDEEQVLILRKRIQLLEQIINDLPSFYKNDSVSFNASNCVEWEMKYKDELKRIRDEK